MYLDHMQPLDPQRLNWSWIRHLDHRRHKHLRHGLIAEDGKNREAAILHTLPRSASFHCGRPQNHHHQCHDESFREAAPFDQLRRGASQPNLLQNQSQQLHLIDIDDNNNLDLEKGIIISDTNRRPGLQLDRSLGMIPAIQFRGHAVDLAAGAAQPLNNAVLVMERIRSNADYYGVSKKSQLPDQKLQEFKRGLAAEDHKKLSSAGSDGDGELEQKVKHVVQEKMETAPSSDDLPRRWNDREMLQQLQLSEPSAERYFRELEGPELDVLQDAERTETVLPTDKIWPFLLRFPIACFGICLGLGSQSILWKVISKAPTIRFLHKQHLMIIPAASQINLVFWFAAMAALLLISTTYALKWVFYPGAVRREFGHPVRINFFFAPWIAGMFLALGRPYDTTTSMDGAIWAALVAPILGLELKVYGRWMTSGHNHRLSEVANPSTHLSVVGNFVAALLASNVGMKEAAIFLWAVGLAHYLVLFVTLYQRLPTASALPSHLHPVFFMFVAAPSTASVAWSHIVSDFDLVSRLSYFVGLFLYASLVVRVNLFCGFRFSMAWWAYTFPMTASAIATIHYSVKVNHPLTQAMAALLSLVSSLTVLSLCVVTLLHILRGTMFPNDMAIAIAAKNSSSRQAMTKKIPAERDGNLEESIMRFSCRSCDYIEDKKCGAGSGAGLGKACIRNHGSSLCIYVNHGLIYGQHALVV